MTKELAEWEDPRVQTVYEMLCDHDERPANPEEHWEGYIARRIVAVLGVTQRSKDPEVLFCCWLRGYFSGLSGKDALTAQEANTIRNTLNALVDTRPDLTSGESK
mgnify:CR=1 FL=1